MGKLKQRITKNSFFYSGSVISFFVLTVIVNLFPLEFSSYKTTDTTAPVWYVITSTGAVYGSIVIILSLFIYLLIHFKKKFKKRKNIFLFIGFVLGTQLLITGISLYYFKTVFQNPRPSQLFLIEKGFIDKSGKEYFAMPLDEKRKYLKEKIDDNKKSFEDVYPPILDSWVEDSGYSFPSGHAQTSFFLGTILAFVIYRTSTKKYYIFFPLAWAILVALSRVVIGVHYPFDVTMGALIGLIAALSIVSLNKVNQIFL